MDKKLSAVVRAFVCGGVICLGIQLIMTALGFVLPPETPLALRGSMALLIGGVVTIALTLTGVYEKIDRFGAMGANVPFIGLVPAVTGIMCEARSHGASLGGAVLAALKAMGMLFGCGFAISLIIGFALTALGVGIFA